MGACGSRAGWSHVIVTARGAGHAGGHRTSGRGRCRRQPGGRGRRRSTGCRPGRLSSWSSPGHPPVGPGSSASAGRRPGRAADASGVVPAIAAVLVVRTTARGHPAQLEDRPGRSRALGPAGAGRAPAGQRHEGPADRRHRACSAPGWCVPCTRGAMRSSCCSAARRRWSLSSAWSRTSWTSPMRRGRAPWQASRR